MSDQKPAPEDTPSEILEKCRAALFAAEDDRKAAEEARDQAVEAAASARRYRDRFVSACKALIGDEAEAVQADRLRAEIADARSELDAACANWQEVIGQRDKARRERDKAIADAEAAEERAQALQRKLDEAAATINKLFV